MAAVISYIENSLTKAPKLRTVIVPCHDKDKLEQELKTGGYYDFVSMRYGDNCVFLAAAYYPDDETIDLKEYLKILMAEYEWR